MKKKSRPWFDEKGKLKPAFVINSLARKWDKETFLDYEKFLVDEQITDQALWEIYLKRFERYQREEQIDHQLYDELACTDNSINDWRPKEEFTGNLIFLKKHLPMAMDTLNEQEKGIIKGIFWKNKSERQLSRESSLSRRLISKHKKKGMEKIKKFLIAVHGELYPNNVLEFKRRGVKNVKRDRTHLSLVGK